MFNVFSIYNGFCGNEINGINRDSIKRGLLSKGEVHNEIEYKQISRNDAAEKH